MADPHVLATMTGLHDLCVTMQISAGSLGSLTSGLDEDEKVPFEDITLGGLLGRGRRASHHRVYLDVYGQRISVSCSLGRAAVFTGHSHECLTSWVGLGAPHSA